LNCSENREIVITCIFRDEEGHLHLDNAEKERAMERCQKDEAALLEERQRRWPFLQLGKRMTPAWTRQKKQRSVFGV
jgi:hypothetical protein